MKRSSDRLYLSGSTSPRGWLQKRASARNAPRPMFAGSQPRSASSISMPASFRRKRAQSVPTTRDQYMLKALTCLSMFLLGSPALAQPFSNCISVKFSPGQSSAIISGKAGQESPFACFLFSTNGKRNASLRLIKTTDDMAFNIDGVKDNESSYSFHATQSMYKVEVYKMFRGGPSPFTLVISLH